MANLYGRTWTRKELEARVGRIEQLGGIRRLRHSEGPEDGAEWIQVRTGAGLSYYVSPHRALDISLAEFAGAPLSWQSINGDVHPAYFEPEGLGWLQTAVGGLLMTCGLMNVGQPSEDQQKHYGLHGRIHHIPARYVSTSAQWDQDEYVMKIKGVVEETSIFGDCLRMTREITSRLGENVIRVHDIIENIGFQDTEHLLLYHINLGFPLMSESTQVVFPATHIEPIVPGTPLEGFDQWQAPTKKYVERVYAHTLHKTYLPEQWASVYVNNPTFPLTSGSHTSLSLEIRWQPHQLNRLIQWKMPGEGMHALGIEPANCGVKGRLLAKEQGDVISLAPGEMKSYDLEIHIHHN